MACPSVHLLVLVLQLRARALLLESIKVSPVLLPCIPLMTRISLFLCLQELSGQHMFVMLVALLLIFAQECSGTLLLPLLRLCSHMLLLLRCAVMPRLLCLLCVHLLLLPQLLLGLLLGLHIVVRLVLLLLFIA
jgi:hypothetical protein